MPAVNAIEQQISAGPSVVQQWLEQLKTLAREGQMILDVSTFNLEGEHSVLDWAREQQIPDVLILRATANLLGVTFCEDFSALSPVKQFLEDTPISFARQHAALALQREDGRVYLVMGSLDAWRHLDTFRRLLGQDIQPAFAENYRLLERINTAYSQRTGQARNVIDSIEEGEISAQVEAMGAKEDLLDGNNRAPVIQLVNAVLFEAVQSGASDVHIQPYEDRVIVRMRIDGILFDVHELPKPVQEEIISRVKVQGKMNIAEKRLPQDGRATVQVGDKLIDLRIASLPSSYGERVVIRLLDKSARLYTLAELGMNHDSHTQFERLVHLEHGLVLVTGPTGSGKSTTLYAALQAINTKNRNVLTLEDPIEYEIAGVSQTQINTKKGLTFATGLRNVLRQDPDIIMVGEIRDQETAVMAIQSALTGHLVFSTLHTNDAASAVTRLLDLGIEPYLVSSSVLAVLAQRLVRRICADCSQERLMTDVERQGLQ
ncbi:MAG: ATPase, T2SS/T4P/T4SS family, partial [Planctomycetota bacterium]